MDFKVGALLKEVQLENSAAFAKLVEDTASAIKKSINDIPDNLKVTADEAPCFVRDIGADKVEFSFKKPSTIEIGGSFSINCVAKPDVNVDLLIRLPKECFFANDFLNYRYHGKRFLYLCIVKKYLDSSSLFNRVEWSSFQNEARKPILLVYPVSSIPEAPQFFVRILPTASHLFQISKLNMKRNNIRSLNNTEERLLVPTPMYNSSILEDVLLEENTEFLMKTFLHWNELREALLLLKVWARQRSSIYAHDCLNGYLVAIIVYYLATHGKVSSPMTPMQIFHVTLDFIANSKLWARGLYLLNADETKASEEKMMFKESFPGVICVSTSCFNLTFRVKSHSFLELRDEAASTLKFQEKFGDSAFEEIFIMKVDFPAKYDYIIRLNLKGLTDFSTSGFCLDDECWRLYEQKTHSLLVQGLGDRAKFVRVMWRNIPLTCSFENGLSIFDAAPLLIGVSVSSMEKLFRVVDIGPDAENKDEALKFRKFWGEKAELRRFKDGRIAESTVWEYEKWMKHLILNRIIEHVLLRHLSIPKSSIVQVAHQLDFSLLHRVGGDPISFSEGILEAFDVLSKCLRLIVDIPLRISSVQPLDSAFRFTSVFPPGPNMLASEKNNSQRISKRTLSCIQPLEVLIQLEGSAKWPTDDVTIEKTKFAFLLKIGESLQNKWGMKCTATEDSVDVLQSGYAFRLKILHQKGLGMTKKEVRNHEVGHISDVDRRLFIRYQHSSMINGLQSLFPIYGAVARLAKRWVAAHLFSACMGEEAVELLVAYLFVRPFPFAPPCSRVTGFLRFLRLLADYDWIFSPLLVDINNDFGPSDKKEIFDNFSSSRRDYGKRNEPIAAAMFLATSYDTASEYWTRVSPSVQELRRLVAYARSSEALLTRLVLEDETDRYRWECLFCTPLHNYDAVIFLHRDKLPFPHHHRLFQPNPAQGRIVARGKASRGFNPFMFSKDAGGRTAQLKHKVLVDFDPSRCYLTDLEKTFDAFKLWYSSLGGDVIGLTWDRCYAKKRKRENGEEEDYVALLKQVGEVGQGLVKSVHLLKAPKLSI